MTVSAGALTMAALALTGCAARPAPPSGLPASAPAPPPPPPRGPVETAVAIRAASDSQAFIVETVATVLAFADTLRRVDSVRTSAELVAVPRGSALDITVRDFRVVSPGVPTRVLQAPVRAIGRFVDAGGLEFEHADLGDCRSLVQSALDATRDLWVRWPAQVQAGDQWSDSSSWRVCRDSIPLTTTVRRDYRVVSLPVGGGDSGVVVERRSSITVSGSGLLRREPVAITGSGSGTMLLTLDPVAGWIRSARGSSEMRLEARAAGRSQFVEQRVQTVVQRAGDPGTISRPGGAASADRDRRRAHSSPQARSSLRVPAP